MEKITLTLVGLMLLVGSTAQARLGETMSQCRARYGKVSERYASSTTYSTGDLHTQVTWENGKAVKLQIRRTQYKPLDDDMIAEIAKANSNATVTVNTEGTVVTVTPKTAAAAAPAPRPKF